MTSLRKALLINQVDELERLIHEYEVDLYHERDPLERARIRRQIGKLDESLKEKEVELFQLEASPNDSLSPVNGVTPRQKDPIPLSVSRLPGTTGRLFGRKNEIAELDLAWDTSTKNILVLVAWGGVGKTALINTWIDKLRESHYQGATAVYAWSFYTQGVTQRNISGQLFIEAALKDFGDPDPKSGTPWEKGVRLSTLIRKRRTLLIIDGLEPLQHPPGPDGGRLKDPALVALLSELAECNEGLCVVTTRLKIAELGKFNKSVIQKELNNVTPKAGAEILKANGVIGRQDELEEAAREFDCHALALTLLGSYLKIVHGGDVSHRDRIVLIENTTPEGQHAKRVMASYESWIREQSTLPDLCLLYLLSLFDRPAEIGALEHLIKKPSIAGLTEELGSLDKATWNYVIARLQTTKLLLEKSFGRSDVLDTHPLVREYFGERLRLEHPAAYYKANRRLCEYYENIVEFQPDNIQDMQFLFQAAVCGCKGELYDHVLHKIYIPRILRGDESYAALVLGASNALLAVLTYFFEKGDWTRPVYLLRKEDKLFILMESGRYLTQIRGYAATEVGQCYRQARELFEDGDSKRDQLEIMLGECRFHRVRGELNKSASLAAEITVLCKDIGDPALFPLGDRAMASNYYYTGNFTDSRFFAGKGAASSLTLEESLANAEFDINDPSLSCRGYEALSIWFLGFPNRARTESLSAVQLARELKHPHTLAIILLIDSMIHQFCRDVPNVEKTSSELISLCSEYGFSLWRKSGEILYFWSQAMRGRKIRRYQKAMQQTVAEWLMTHAELFVPYWYGLLGETLLLTKSAERARQMIETGLHFSNKNNERWWDIELLRLKAESLAITPNKLIEAEETLNQAMHRAREQRAISLQLRVLISEFDLNDGRQICNDEIIAKVKHITGKFPELNDSIDFARFKNIATDFEKC